MKRIRCCVGDCQHTMSHETACKRFGHVPDEWMCHMHWSRLTKNERRVWNRKRRLQRRFGCEVLPSAASRIWTGLKRRAAL